MISSMIATLCSYENCFGPYHPQTLALTMELAAALWQSGDANSARRLLERVLRDAPEDSELRSRAKAVLGDILAGSVKTYTQ
jgi:FimV-like protein